MKMANRTLLLLSLSVLLPACLQTRAQLKSDGGVNNRPVASSPVSSAPAKTSSAQSAHMDSNKWDEVNKDFRELNGRIEVVENQLNQVKDSEKVKALETKINTLETKISLLEATVADLNNKSKKEAAAPKKVDELAEASKHFEDKKWEDAILASEEYRKNNPKGKSYAEATYKIGVSFQNLGMKDDARAFYKEVTEKFPQSKEAGLAKSKLKKI